MKPSTFHFVVLFTIQLLAVVICFKTKVAHQKSTIKIILQTNISQACGAVYPRKCTDSRYRSIDGSCNNLLRPAWGTSNTPFIRLLPNNYADGISEWPVSKSGNPLPLPRKLSLTLFPAKDTVNYTFNLNSVQWGQLIAHDLGHNSNNSLTRQKVSSCCRYGHLSKELINVTCASIMLPNIDPRKSVEHMECLNFPFARTETTRDIWCTSPNTPAEQINQSTAFLDLSMMYGNDTARAAILRAKQGGKLRTEYRKGQEWPPQNYNSTVCQNVAVNETCFLSGDERINQNTQISVLMVILIREHNRVANILAKLNPHWSDETLYQETRRIVIAEAQHIAYYHYLPILLGYQHMVENKLIYPGARGYVNDYNPEVDPSILNEFNQAAYRHFHNMLKGNLQLYNEKCKVVGTIRLSNWYHRPMVLNLKYKQLLRGLLMQPVGASDQYWDSEVTQFLFKKEDFYASHGGPMKFLIDSKRGAVFDRNNRTCGDDLRSVDIQRGRDHGLGSYLSGRAACGLLVPKTFKDLENFILPKNVKLLEKLYESPEDIDLVVGGSLEINAQNALTGPTFLCIITKQFYRTRVGDRYFYENGFSKLTSLTLGQLQTIRKGASVARLMCDNAGIHEIQRNAFKRILPSNELEPCEKLPKVDFTLWKDNSHN